MRRKFERYYSSDPRDRDYQLRRQRTRRVHRYWRDAGYVLDQRDLPHCVGYAWTHWLLADPIRQYLAPSGIYTLAQRVDEWDGHEYDGTSVRAGAKVLHHLGLVAEYRWAWSLDAVINTLLTRGPMVLGTLWTSGMNRPDQRNQIHATGDFLGGHAYLAYGCNTRREVIGIKNSWGEEWGHRGKAWLSFEDLEELLKLDGEACIAMEMRAVPADH